MIVAAEYYKLEIVEIREILIGKFPFLFPFFIIITVLYYEGVGRNAL